MDTEKKNHRTNQLKSSHLRMTTNDQTLITIFWIHYMKTCLPDKSIMLGKMEEKHQNIDELSYFQNEYIVENLRDKVGTGHPGKGISIWSLRVNIDLMASNNQSLNILVAIQKSSCPYCNYLFCSSCNNGLLAHSFISRISRIRETKFH